MKRKKAVVVMSVLAVGIALVFAGCAQQLAVKEEPPMEKQAAVEKRAAAAPAETGKQKELTEVDDETLQEALDKAWHEAREKEYAEAAKRINSELVDIHFAFDRSDLKPEDREILRKNAALLKEYSAFAVRIEGYCDEKGTAEYNLALGEKRAVSAMKYLMELGVAKSRITTISYGKELPLDPGHNEEAWAKNRRAHFVVTLEK